MFRILIIRIILDNKIVASLDLAMSLHILLCLFNKTSLGFVMSLGLQPIQDVPCTPCISLASFPE